MFFRQILGLQRKDHSCLCFIDLSATTTRIPSSHGASLLQQPACIDRSSMSSSFSVCLALGVWEFLLGFFHGAAVIELLAAMCLKRRSELSRIQHVEDAARTRSFLDLPELAIENVLARLPPCSLCKMGAVCRELRDRCRSNHLWEPHLKAKWGSVAGPAAFKGWQISEARHRLYSSAVEQQRARKALVWPLSCIWPLPWVKPQAPERNDEAFPIDSFMAWYWALESGAFWFPGQVYNRENGHVGFMLSCYDAELGYDRRTDTFRARYPPHGSRTVVIEEGVQWERLRAPPVNTLSHELYVSECLYELRPGDHVEVQWRRNKDFPYGWWYGVVGHLEMCDRETRHCHCHLDDTIWLEFKQYTVGSRWRRAAVNRKTHREEGNESEGYYAGIRKLCSKGEISIWKQLWPNETLE